MNAAAAVRPLMRDVASAAIAAFASRVPATPFPHRAERALGDTAQVARSAIEAFSREIVDASSGRPPQPRDRTATLAPARTPAAVAGGADARAVVRLAALWWTAMLMTTMGSDYWPRSPEARVLCLLLALYAFAVFGYVTAALASFFVGRDAQAHEGEIASAAQIERLRAEVAALRREIGAATAGRPGDAPR